MYNGLVSGCKHFIGIKGGSHCQMAEFSAACSFGESTCTPAPAITRTAQHKVIDTFVLPWLDYTLKGNCAAGSLFNAKLLSDTAITFQKNCDLCGTAAVGAPVALARLKIAPNPASAFMQFSDIPEYYSTLSIFDLTGRLIMAEQVQSNLEVSVAEYPGGSYIYQLSGQGAQPLRGLIQVNR
jgi:hypothetical protein